VAEKRRIVELTLQLGTSVARVAQAEGVNLHQVFQWRRAYRNGELSDEGEPATTLLPVVMASSCSKEAIESSGKTTQEHVSVGAIHIELPGRATITVEHGADRAALQAILESLRK
jgi:transposase